MYLKRSLLITATTIAFVSHSASANDARSIALGGSAITQGQGIHGVFANPASLMHLKRKGHGFHFRLGVAGDFRDPGKFFETAVDNDTIVDDFSNNIDVLTSTNIECFGPNVTDESICVSNTTGLGNEFARVLDIVETVSAKPIELLAEGQVGLGNTNVRHPFAVHFGFSVAAAGDLTATDSDIEYISIFRDSLIDGELTFGDIQNAVLAGQQIIAVDQNSQEPVSVVRPEDVLTTEFSGIRIDRRQVGVSFGRSFEVNGRTLDVGITPKVSSISTYRTAGTIASEFDSTIPSLTDDFLDTETNTTTFTVDVGSTYLVSEEMAISSVIRNLVPETADTPLESVTVETTPQLIVGGAYQFKRVTINADIALNTAKRDGIETQPLSLGAELGRGKYSLRGGVSVDNGRVADKAAITLGFGLGPLQVGARVASTNAIQASAQLSYSF